MNTKLLFAFCLASLIVGNSCKKATTDNSSYIPLYLTDKVWVFDTLLINLPATYATLSDTAKYSYNVAKAFLKNAKIGFKKDGSVSMDGDYDFGYTNWQLINNNADLEMTLPSGKDTLYNWKADALELTYIKSFENFFNATFKYK